MTASPVTSVLVLWITRRGPRIQQCCRVSPKCFVGGFHQLGHFTRRKFGQLFLGLCDVGVLRRFSCAGKGARARMIVTQQTAGVVCKCAKQGRAKVVKHLIFPTFASSSSCFIQCPKTSFGNLPPAFGPAQP